MPIPLKWSTPLDLGSVDFTMAVWFKTTSDGTLFSKVKPSLTTYDDSIKAVYIEGGILRVKLAPGSSYEIPQFVTDDKWHHVAIVVRQGTPFET